VPKVPPITTPSGEATQATSSYFEFVTLKVDSKGNEESRATKSAEYFVENLGDGVTLEMIKIPPGEFIMGSPKEEAGRYKDEEPQHQVRVPEFFIGRFEVTREQWRAVAKMPMVRIDLKDDPSGFKDAGRDPWRLPVEQVSWDDVVEFCARLAKKTGMAYRLPSEAEWEYDCRAGTTTPFAFGPTITPGVVNYDGNYPYGSAEKGEYRDKTVEVGSLGFANAFGLYDMHGNVWEWCQDVYHDSYANAPNDGSAWVTGGEQGRRVLRGGSWIGFGDNCRSAFRSYNAQDVRGSGMGFRVVVSARTQ